MALSVHRGWDHVRQGYRASPAHSAAIADARREWKRLHENPPAIAPGSMIAPHAKVTRVRWKDGKYEYHLQNGVHSGHYDMDTLLQIRAAIYAETPPLSAPPPSPCAAQFWLPAGAPHHVAELNEGEPTELTKEIQAREKFKAFMADIQESLIELPIIPVMVTEEDEPSILDTFLKQAAEKRAEGRQKPKKQGKVKNSRDLRSGGRKGKNVRRAPRIQSGGLRIRKVAA